MPWLTCAHSPTHRQQTHRLLKALTTIGRDPANDIVIDDPRIAKTHASLVKTGRSFTIACNDRSATLRQEGRAIKSLRLTYGDRVELEGWVLTLHEHEPAKAPTPDEVDVDLLTRLVQLSADMMDDTSPDRLFATLLTGLVSVTGAEKGFFILMKDGQRHLAASHNVSDETLDLSRVSDSIIEQVAKSRTPLIVSDALRDDRFGRAKSVVDLKLSSVMCVPLIHQGDLLGVIYLGNDAITGLFTARDLTVLRIYASQASLVVYHALLLNQLRLDNEALRTAYDAGQGAIIGTSRPMRSVYGVLKKVGPTDLSSLILGETGTGKELVAREIHRLSTRSSGAFIAINCGAIPEHLLESELFGHRKGAFTGATADKLGKIEAADGGTLFLDEIGEMPMNLQVKLLRVLQERSIERVGDVQPRPINIRVLAATNRDPEEMIADGTFRQDLFYRLNEIAIPLPALRDRGEDITVLATFFLNKYKQQYGARAHGFTNPAFVAMKSYYWPGNVRPLENRIKKALIMSDRALLRPRDLGLENVDKAHIVPLSEAQEAFKMDYIQKVLDMNNGNKAATARDLGVDARTIFRYVEKIEAQE